MNWKKLFWLKRTELSVITPGRYPRRRQKRWRKKQEAQEGFEGSQQDKGEGGTCGKERDGEDTVDGGEAQRIGFGRGDSHNLGWWCQWGWWQWSRMGMCRVQGCGPSCGWLENSKGEFEDNYREQISRWRGCKNVDVGATTSFTFWWISREYTLDMYIDEKCKHPGSVYKERVARITRIKQGVVKEHVPHVKIACKDSSFLSWGSLTSKEEATSSN